jgi:hypothetical protein
VVFKPDEDSAIHILEELQVVDSQNSYSAYARGVFVDIFLCNARLYGSKNMEPLANAIVPSPELGLLEIYTCMVTIYYAHVNSHCTVC